MWAGPVITTNVVFLPAALRRPFIQSWMIIQKRQHQETYADIVDVRLDIAVLRPMGLDIVLSLKPVYTLQYLSTRSNTCLHAPISVYTLQYLSTRSNTCLHAPIPVYTLQYLCTRSITCRHALLPVYTHRSICFAKPVSVFGVCVCVCVCVWLSSCHGPELEQFWVSKL